MCCYNLNSYCTSLLATLILYRTGSLFSAPYQFFMCSHLSLGDECHPNTGYWSFHLSPRHWHFLDTERRKGEDLVVLILTLKLALLLSDIFLFHRTIGLPEFSKIIHPRWGFQSTPTLHNNHLRAFFLFYPVATFLPAATIDPVLSNMNDFQWHLIINLLDESGLCLPSICSLEKNEWGLLQMVMPFRSLSVMEQLGSYSPEWVLGSVQAAAVNEVFPPLSCWGFWLCVYLASVLSAHVSVWDHAQGIGKQFGPMKPEASACRMPAVAKADMQS